MRCVNATSADALQLEGGGAGVCEAAAPRPLVHPQPQRRQQGAAGQAIQRHNLQVGRLGGCGCDGLLQSMQCS